MRRSSIAGLLLLVAVPGAWALDSDRGQPVELSADQAELNNVTGVGVYTGDVVLTQGSMRITADRMTIHTTPEGQLARIVAEGDLATFRQLPEGETEYIRARAPRMEYTATQPAFVELTGGAVLTQGKNEFRGQLIRYDVGQDLVTARGGEGGDERIRITLFPENRPAGDGDGP